MPPDVSMWLHIAIIAYLVLRDVVLILRQVIIGLGGTVPPNGVDGNDHAQ